MTELEIYNALFSGGRFSLPYLVEFSQPGAESICLVNALQDVEYNGKLYKHSTFDYKEPDIQGQGATLSVTLAENDLIQFIDAADWQMKINIIGVINKDGEIEKINIFKHMFATVTWDSENKMELQLNTDDRMQMTFPPYVFDSDNNRGGA